MAAKKTRYRFVRASFTHYIITGNDDRASYEFGRLHNQGGSMWSVHIADHTALVSGFPNAKARAIKALDALAAVLRNDDPKFALAGHDDTGIKASEEAEEAASAPSPGR